MKIIQLTKGKEVLVDDEDYEYLSQFKWYYHHTGYAVRNTARPNRKTLPMHRVIIETPKGMKTDHINGDTLDNRKENLRVCSNSENCKNQKKRKGEHTSQYKGVYWSKSHQRWRVVLTKDYKRVEVGLFKEEIEAAKAYNEAALKYHGEFARLNDL